MKQRSHRQTSRLSTFRAAVKALTFSGLAVGTLVGLSPEARANTENYWTGTTGDFNDPTQWSLARVPITPAPDGTGADNADVFNGGTVTISTDGLVPNDVNAGGTGNGVTGDGTYTQTAGSIHIGTAGGWFRLGTSSGTTGTYNLQGGTLDFGNLNGDGTPNNGAQVNIGETNNATGALNVTGGVFNNVIAAPRIAVGQGGAGSSGTLAISGVNTQFNNNGELWIGQGNGSTGVLNMSGGVLNEHNWLAIGRQSATGTLNFSGGTINKDSSINGGSHVTLAGIDTTQTATVNQTGGDFVVAAGGNSIWVGETGTAIWNISGGTLTASDGIILAVQDAAAQGTLNILPPNGDAAAPVVTTPTLTVGSGVNQFDGTTVTNFTSALLNLSGGTLATGGLVAAAGVGTRTANLNGGTLQVTAPSTDYIASAITVTVGTGGAIINTNGNDTTINAPLTSAGGTDGGLSKLGAGLLTLTGANSYTGPTNVAAGALVVNGSIGSGVGAGAVSVAQGATLSGTGTLILGANTVTSAGILAPGATPNIGTIGMLTVATTGTLTLTSTNVTQFDLTTTVNKDLIMATGANLAIQGGTLALNVPGNFDYTATYTLFSGLASETGTFTSVTGTNTTRIPTFTFAGGNYNLSFAAVPEPSTWALGVFGLGMGALWLRRRRVA